MRAQKDHEFIVPILVCGEIMEASDWYQQLLDRGENPEDAAACVDDAVEEYFKARCNSSRANGGAR